MARRPLEPGEWGEITVTRTGNTGASAFRARAKFRDFNGRARVMERSGTSRRAARKALVEVLEERARTGGVGITAQDTFTTVAEGWFEDMRQLVRLGQRSPGTVETYQRQWTAHVRPALGALRLAQVTTPVVDRVLVDVHERVGSATARTCRAIISGVMGRAVRHGAVLANPTREVRRLTSTSQRQPRALTDEERTLWFLGIARDEAAVRRDLVDLSAFLLATGLRIGEVLAVVWSEVDMDRGAVDVSSTLIRVTGEGLIRKPTKSAAGQRLLLLPTWAVEMLKRRASIGVGPDEPVFGTIDATFRDPRTVSRWLKEAREAVGLGWVTAHSWRKTTATILDGSGVTGRLIADQLGHSRVSMTQDAYLGRRGADPRVLAALEGVNPHEAPREKGGQTSGSEAAYRGR